MSTRKPATNRKRQRENSNCPHAPQRKSRRLLAMNKEPTKITDLNDDCLAKIFGHLNLRSLFNVAVANKWLRPAAGIIYKRKFGDKEVCLQYIQPSSIPCLEPYTSYERIYVEGLKPCLQFLRGLGPSVSRLCIRYDDWSKKQCDYINQYINEYCANSLVAIQLLFKPNRCPIKHFEKPFVNVQTVSANGNCLGNQLPLFNQWFPNMRSLRLFDIRTLHSIGEPFNNLKELCISISGNGDLGHTKVKAIRLLQLHPQLHSLVITMHGPEHEAMRVLLNAINANEVVRYLKVTHSRMVNVDMHSTDTQRLIQEHPFLVHLQLYGITVASNDVIKLANQLKSLMKFRCQILHRLEYNHIESQLKQQWQPLYGKRSRVSYVKLER